MAINLNGTTGITTTGLTSNGIDDNATSTAMTLDSSGRVGIGTSSPNSALETVGADGITISNSGDTYLQLKTTGSTATNYIEFKDSGGSAGSISYNHTNNYLATKVNGSERMRLDTSGNVLVGKTAQNSDNAGVELRAGGQTTATRSASWVGLFNRLTDDGDIVRFQKDSTTVGSIGTGSGVMAIAGPTGNGLSFPNNLVLPATSSAGAKDASTDLGVSYSRFKDLYLSGGVYLGGVGSSNLLDDYEEGTWSPTDSGGNAFTYAGQGAASQTYTKIGRQVFLNMDLVGTTSTSGSQVHGLPFTASTSLGNAGNLIQGYAHGGMPANTRGHVYTNVLYLYDGSTAVSWSNGRRIIGTVVYNV